VADKLPRRTVRLLLVKDGAIMVDYDFSSNADALVAFLLVCAIVAIALV
jgi:hypothetical protein